MLRSQATDATYGEYLIPGHEGNVILAADASDHGEEDAIRLDQVQILDDGSVEWFDPVHFIWSKLSNVAIQVEWSS